MNVNAISSTFSRRSSRQFFNMWKSSGSWTGGESGRVFNERASIDGAVLRFPFHTRGAGSRGQRRSSMDLALKEGFEHPLIEVEGASQGCLKGSVR